MLVLPHNFPSEYFPCLFLCLFFKVASANAQVRLATYLVLYFAGGCFGPCAKLPASTCGPVAACVSASARAYTVDLVGSEPWRRINVTMKLHADKFQFHRAIRLSLMMTPVGMYVCCV